MSLLYTNIRFRSIFETLTTFSRIQVAILVVGRIGNCFALRSFKTWKWDSSLRRAYVKLATQGESLNHTPTAGCVTLSKWFYFVRFFSALKRLYKLCTHLSWGQNFSYPLPVNHTPLLVNNDYYNTLCMGWGTRDKIVLAISVLFLDTNAK